MNIVKSAKLELISIKKSVRNWESYRGCDSIALLAQIRRMYESIIVSDIETAKKYYSVKIILPEWVANHLFGIEETHCYMGWFRRNRQVKAGAISYRRDSSGKYLFSKKQTLKRV